MNFPFLTFNKLWHVGTMNPVHKREGSLEGGGLSVSIHPEAWITISEFTGGDTWELTKPGNRFLDFHRLTDAQKKHIAAWGVENGYARRQTLFRVEYHDDEWETDLYSDYENRKEAEAEAEGHEVGVQTIPNGLVSTDRLTSRVKNPGGGTSFVTTGHLATIFTEDVLGLDGVWWQDDFAPDKYSAPRGVIVPSKVQSWARKIVPLERAGVDYDEFMPQSNSESEHGMVRVRGPEVRVRGHRRRW